MGKQELLINPYILRWAREEACLSLEEAAGRAGIKPLQPRGDKPGVSPSERLSAWEEGIIHPTLPQLEKVAKAYRRPLLTFFLKTPPRRVTILKDFRTIGDKSQHSDTPEFSAFKRRMEVFQKSLRSLVDDIGGRILEFVASKSTQDDSSQVAYEIRRKLKFSIDQQIQLPSSERLLSTLRRRAEDAGIFVLLQGNLGSYHTNISPEEFRGLLISDQYAPLVVVNPNDAKAAQTFTLIHELAHLWLGESGYGNYNSFEAMDAKVHEDREKFCNSVAAEFLAPQEMVTSAWKNESHDGLETAAANISRRFKVSRIVIARRLLDIGLIGRDEYWCYYRTCQAIWQHKKDIIKQSEGGPGYYQQIASRFGKRIINTVVDAAFDGKISYLDASQLLGVKIENFGRIAQEVR